MRPLRETGRLVLTLLLGFTALWSGSCALKLPAPENHTSRLSDPTILKRLCPDGVGTTHFLLQGESHVTGALSCQPSHATLVLLNTIGVRIRTISLSSTGEAHDEISYLSTNQSPVDELCALLAAALEAPTHDAHSPSLGLEITISQ